MARSGAAALPEITAAAPAMSSNASCYGTLMQERLRGIAELRRMTEMSGAAGERRWSLYHPVASE